MEFIACMLKGARWIGLPSTAMVTNAPIRRSSVVRLMRRMKPAVVPSRLSLAKRFCTEGASDFERLGESRGRRARSFHL